jgi:N-acetylneuraminic acid mutarotase
MKKVAFTLLALWCAFLTDAQSWTQSANLPALGRRGAVSLSINGEVYVGGGLDSAGVLLSDFYMYDPGTNTWTQKANLPVNLGGSACFTVNGKGYLASGASGTGNAISNVYQYDPVLDQWTAEATFPGTARENSIRFFYW